MLMRESTRRVAVAVAAGALVAAACSGGDSSPTTTRFIPPTSEVIFSLTTTTTTPPGPLDPVFVESLGITVDIPRDWEFRTDALRFGRASAVFRADNNAGALIVVGTVEDVLPEGAEPPTAQPGDLAPILVTLLNVAEPLPAAALVTVGDPVAGPADNVAYTLQAYAVTEESGAAAFMEIAVYDDLDPVVFIAVLYQDGLPEDRIAQTRIFDTLAAG